MLAWNRVDIRRRIKERMKKWLLFPTLFVKLNTSQHFLHHRVSCWWLTRYVLITFYICILSWTVLVGNCAFIFHYFFYLYHMYIPIMINSSSPVCKFHCCKTIPVFLTIKPAYKFIIMQRMAYLMIESQKVVNQ